VLFFCSFDGRGVDGIIVFALKSIALVQLIVRVMHTVDLILPY
jgi:hypothetical protein